MLATKHSKTLASLTWLLISQFNVTVGLLDKTISQFLNASRLYWHNKDVVNKKTCLTHITVMALGLSLNCSKFQGGYSFRTVIWLQTSTICQMFKDYIYLITT